MTVRDIVLSKALLIGTVPPLSHRLGLQGTLGLICSQDSSCRSGFEYRTFYRCRFTDPPCPGAKYNSLNPLLEKLNVVTNQSKNKIKSNRERATYCSPKKSEQMSNIFFCSVFQLCPKLSVRFCLASTI